MKELTGSEINGLRFKIHIDGQTYDKIMSWVCKYKTEISGYGTVEYDIDKKLFIVKDAAILDVSSSSAETTIEAGIAGKYYNENRTDGAGKWHWHSHHSMGAFWSATDKSLIRGLGQNQEWLIATVFNNKSETKSAFYQMTEVMGDKHEIFMEDVPTTIMRYYDRSVIDSWADEAKKIEDMCEKNRPKSNYYSPGGYDYYGPSQPSLWRQDKFWESKVWRDDVPIPQTKDRTHVGGLMVDAYDDEGWSYVSKLDRAIYNPLKDKGIVGGETAIWYEVAALEPEEFKYLYHEDKDFKCFADNYFDDRERREIMK